MAEEKEKNFKNSAYEPLAMISLVAVVAIVGIVVLFMNKGPATTVLTLNPSGLNSDRISMASSPSLPSPPTAKDSNLVGQQAANEKENGPCFNDWVDLNDMFEHCSRVANLYEMPAGDSNMAREKCWANYKVQYYTYFNNCGWLYDD